MIVAAMIVGCAACSSDDVPINTQAQFGLDGSASSSSGGSSGGSGSGGSSGGDGSISSDATTRPEAGPPLPDPCIEAGTCPPGVWINVTPPNANITDQLDCGNFGTQSVQADPLTPGIFYAQFMCQGIWKSTDYGLTWTGPINTGKNGQAAGDAAGGIVLPQGAGAAEPPIILSAGIRGNGTGFWKSTNGGVDWTHFTVQPTPSRQDYYPPVIDPYDANHLLMAGHEMDALVESSDGGQTWTSVNLDPGMNENGGTGAIFIVDTGSAPTTRTTFLWMAQQSGGTYGTWRTTNDGASWTQVDKTEHPHGNSQIYQPDLTGTVYMAGAYSTLGWGVLRSTDYGATWAHVGGTNNEAIVFGTKKNVYAMYGWAIGVGQQVDPSLEIVAQPGTGSWAPATTPQGMSQGPAQAAIASDASHSVIVAACWNAGLWRYEEP